MIQMRSDAPATRGTDVIGLRKAVVTSVYCIILSIALLVSVCLAWYVQSVAKENTVQASSFGVTARINGETVVPQDDGSITATLDPNQTYAITLTCIAETNGHGFCLVTAGGQSYKTEVLGKCNDSTCTLCCGEKVTQEFAIVVPEGEGLEITMIPQWGNREMSADVEEITSGETIPYTGGGLS